MTARLPRVTDRDIREALLCLNRKRGLSMSNQIGWHYWADVRGEGRYRPRVWVVVNAQGGVSSSDLNRPTRRGTYDAIQRLI